MGKKYERAACGTCGGSGTVERNYRDKDGKWQTETKTCPDCKGTGERR